MTVATVVAVFFMVLFGLLARREHRLKTTKRHSSPRGDSPSRISGTSQS
jgi:hypothetical protein